MKPVVKINYADWVENFDPKDNYFHHLLEPFYELEISEKPEILFTNPYGLEKYKFNCLKVHFCGENQRPNFLDYDFAMTSDFIEDERHLRLPLYILYLDMYERMRKKGKYFNIRSSEESLITILKDGHSIEDAENALQRKKKFCCILNSNPAAQFRIDVFNELSKYKQVDSGGKVLNNLGFSVSDKIDFIKDYKFVFAMENSSFSGYTTEKILEPMLVDSVPLYWGNPKINQDFNPASFVDYNDFNSIDDFINKIIELDKNDQKYTELLTQSRLNQDIYKKYFEENVDLNFLRNIIDNRKSILPVSKTLKGCSRKLGKKAYDLRIKFGQIGRKFFKLI